MEAGEEDDPEGRADGEERSRAGRRVSHPLQRRRVRSRGASGHQPVGQPGLHGARDRLPPAPLALDPPKWRVTKCRDSLPAVLQMDGQNGR